MRLTQRVLTGSAFGIFGLLSLSVAPAVHAQRGQTIRCESTDGKFSRCNMPWRNVALVRQESKGACIRNQSWGVDRQGLWVDRGCRGLFAEARDDRPEYGRPDHGRPDYGRPGDGRPDGGWRPGPGWNQRINLTCSSHGQGYQMCQVDVGRRGQVQLVDRLSGASCTEGRTWGWNRAGVWVDRGCRARFVVDRRW